MSTPILTVAQIEGEATLTLSQILRKRTKIAVEEYHQIFTVRVDFPHELPQFHVLSTNRAVERLPSRSMDHKVIGPVRLVTSEDSAEEAQVAVEEVVDYLEGFRLYSYGEYDHADSSTVSIDPRLLSILGLRVNNNPAVANYAAELDTLAEAIGTLATKTAAEITAHHTGAAIHTRRELLALANKVRNAAVSAEGQIEVLNYMLAKELS